MIAYRLYTVTPRLLNLIEQLTNWYIRFNRKRLKGENGPEDTLRALNVLFEVLQTLCQMMAPFTPFVTESMYQNLQKFLPASQEDTRSVHFLPFPSVKEEYFNDDVERAVDRMQQVIELGRYIRESRTLSLKVRLPHHNHFKFYQERVLTCHLLVVWVARVISPFRVEI